MRSYELIDHTADIGLRAYADSLPGLFENMALGMFSLIADQSMITGKLKKKISVEAANEEELLVEWLNELLYLHTVKKYLFKSFKVTRILYHQKLEAEAYGVKLSGKDRLCLLKREIKAATYYKLQIRQENGMYMAEVIFDV